MRTLNRGLVVALVMALLATWGCAGAKTPRRSPRMAMAQRLASQGSYWYERGCLERARRYFAEALEASRLLDDLGGMLRARNNLAAVALAQGRQEEASTHLQAAMDLNKLVRSKKEESFTLGHLAALAYRAGRFEQAEDLWRQAAAVAETVEGHPGLASHLAHLGMLLRQQTRLPEAEAVLNRALAAGEKAKLANVHHQLALVAMARGDYDLAERQLQKARALDRQSENSLGLATDLEAMGKLYQRRQQWEQAALELERALRLYAALGYMERAERVFELLKENQRQGDFPRSIDGLRPLLKPPGEVWESPLCK